MNSPLIKKKYLCIFRRPSIWNGFVYTLSVLVGSMGIHIGLPGGHGSKVDACAGGLNREIMNPELHVWYSYVFLDAKFS